MMRVVKIEDASTIEEIRRAINSPRTHTLRFSVSENSLKIKVNSGVWSPPLGVIEVND